MLPLFRTLLLLAAGFIVLAFAYPQDNDSYTYGRQKTKNDTQTAVFCYINGTRLMLPYQTNNYQSRHFSIDDVRIDLCTHLVYGGAELDRNGNTIKPIDLDMSLKNGDKISYTDLTDLKKRRSDLKVLLSVSGSASDFSAIASGNSDFKQNVVRFLDRFQFDGLNVDWRYPARAGSNKDDKTYFRNFMTQMKQAFRDSAKILTAVVPTHEKAVKEGYDVYDRVLMDAVDFWLIMSVDYSAEWHHIAANAPIRSREPMDVENTVKELKYLFDSNSYKLILAIPFYGKKFQLKHAVMENELPLGKEILGAPAIMTYREICQKMNHKNEIWVRRWHDESKVPYIYKDLSVIVYDDAESVKAKTNYALRNGLGGVMAFSIEMDDYDGDCGSQPLNDRRDSNNRLDHAYQSQDRSARKHPLLQSIYDTVQRGPNSAALQSSPVALVLAIVCAMILAHQG